MKSRRYQREGIPAYWIVDGDARIVEMCDRMIRRPEMIAGWLEWQPDAGVAPLISDLRKLFASALEK